MALIHHRMCLSLDVFAPKRTKKLKVGPRISDTKEHP